MKPGLGVNLFEDAASGLRRLHRAFPVAGSAQTREILPMQDQVQLQDHPWTAKSIIWTVIALAAVVAFAVYMGMQ